MIPLRLLPVRASLGRFRPPAPTHAQQIGGWSRFASATAQDFLSTSKRSRVAALASAFALPEEIRRVQPGGVLLYESSAVSSKRVMMTLVAAGSAGTSGNRETLHHEPCCVVDSPPHVRPAISSATIATLIAVDLTSMPQWMVTVLFGVGLSAMTICTGGECQHSRIIRTRTLSARSFLPAQPCGQRSAT